jgi:hypothetical protein
MVSLVWKNVCRLTILGAFLKRLLKATTTLFVRPSVRMQQRASCRTDFRKIPYLELVLRFVGNFPIWVKIGQDLTDTFREGDRDSVFSVRYKLAPEKQSAV